MAQIWDVGVYDLMSSIIYCRFANFGPHIHNGVKDLVQALERTRQLEIFFWGFKTGKRSTMSL